MGTVVYLRISQDRTGQQAGIQRQQEDCLALAARLGIADPLVFIDNDVSAFDGGRRPGYDAMVTQVRGGASLIIVWHVDRLYRQPRELEDLIDLVEQHPVRIEAVRGGGFDLNATEGRLMARQLVAIAAYESGHKSDRFKGHASLDKRRRHLSLGLSSDVIEREPGDLGGCLHEVHLECARRNHSLIQQQRHRPFWSHERNRIAIAPRRRAASRGTVDLRVSG